MLSKLINHFREPTAEQLARRELEEAKRKLLDHTAAAEYHNAMSKMLEDRILRLTDDSRSVVNAAVRAAQPRFNQSIRQHQAA